MTAFKHGISEIIDKFNINVKNVPILFDESVVNLKHSGKEGLWLERKLGLTPNCFNQPDINGFEIKNTIMDSKKPISFGDYSASEYLFSKHNSYIMQYNQNNCFSVDDVNTCTRSDFLRIFGTAKPVKKCAAKKDDGGKKDYDKDDDDDVKKCNNICRYSWSGKCAPKYYNKWSECGQILLMNETNDLCIFYCFDKDLRENRADIIPKSIQTQPTTNYLVVIWFRAKLESNINNKFNKNGIIIAERKRQEGKGKSSHATFNRLRVGKPFDYEHFVHNLFSHRIYFDSGMYDGNNRPYSMFRCADTLFWNELLINDDCLI